MLNDTNEYVLEHSFDAESCWNFKDGVKDSRPLVS